MKAYIFCIVSLTICVFSSFESWSQDKMYIPTLNGHRFISNRIVTDPFIKSSFRVNMGLGESMKVNLPSISIGDTTITPSAGTLIFANLNGRLDIKLNENVAYHLRVSLSARLGAEPSSLYTNGLNTIVGIHNAWKIRLFRNKKHYLSTMVGISTYDASVINISKFISDIINDRPGADISQDINVLQGFIDLNYAYAFGSLVGMNLMGHFSYGDLFESGKSGEQGTASIALDLNLYPKTKVPLGLSAAYGYASIPEYTTAQYNSTSIFNAKLAYTGSDSFIISLDAASFTAPYLLGRISETSKVETRVFNYAVNVLIYFD